MTADPEDLARIRPVLLPVSATVVMAIYSITMQRLGTPVEAWALLIHDGLALISASWQLAAVRKARWGLPALLVGVLHLALLVPLWFGWRLGLSGDAF